MVLHTTVKVSKRYQIAIPAIARERLNIETGDRLLVDVQDGMILLLPEPENYTAYLAGLHHEIWESADNKDYLDQERGSWDNSSGS